MKRGNIPLFITLLACYGNIQAAGFDCSLKTLNKTEKTICNTPSLNGIDVIANKRYAIAVENSLSKGDLNKEQRAWLARRNTCGNDAVCIKDEYQIRIEQLEDIDTFTVVDNLFEGKIENKLEDGIKSPDGFTISESSWRAKRIFLFDDNPMESYEGEGQWDVLAHRVIDGDLVIFFSVTTMRSAKIYAYTNSVPYKRKLRLVSFHQFYTITDYTPNVTLRDIDDKTIRYSVSYDGGEHRVSQQYEMPIANKSFSQAKEIELPAVIDNNEKWTGYCGINSCISHTGSPDGKWRIASDDSIYYFPSDRPDLGINVFFHETGDYASPTCCQRNYTWGDKNTFYFDDYGRAKGIWKTDIDKKTTQRILPVSGATKPYYINYNGVSYIIIRHTSNKNYDTHRNGFYIFKE